MSERAVRRAALVVPTLAAATVVLLRYAPVYDPDAFWHLATGRWIAAHRAIPTVDAFSHTALGRPMLFVDAAADLLLYGAWSLGGFGAVALLAGAAGALAVALALRSAAADGDEGARWDALLLTAVALVAAVVFRVTPRPQTFALPCFAALLGAVSAARRSDRWLALAPPLIALWQLLHPSAPLGVALLGVAAASVTWSRRGGAGPRVAPWWIALALSALALLASPGALGRLGAGFGHVSDARMATLITEWAPLLRHDYAMPWALAFYALIALALAGVVDAARARALRVEVALIALVTSAQAFRAVRFVPLAAIALTPLALRGAGALLGRLRGPARGAVAVALAALLGWLCLTPQDRGFGAGVSAQMLPVGSARFLREHTARGAMINDFLFGGYLIWTLAGRHPVFIDGRSMALYDPDFVEEFLRAREPELERIIARHGAGILVLRTSSLLTWAGALREWSVVHFDDTSFVAVRDAGNEALVAAYGYRAIHPGDWAADVARLRADPSAVPAARAEAERAAREAPDASLARVLEGAVALGAGDHVAAERAFDLAVRLRPASVPALRGRLMSCVLRGDARCVCDRARAVLSLAPTNRYAREAAQRAGCDAR